MGFTGRFRPRMKHIQYSKGFSVTGPKSEDEI